MQYASEMAKEPGALPRFNRSRTFQFFLSTTFVGIAFALRSFFAPELGGSIPFTFFVTASILSAWVGGWATGVYSMVLGWFLGSWFFIPPTGTLGLYSKVHFISLLANFLPNLIAILAIEQLHRSQKARLRAEARLYEATERIKEQNLQLERQVEVRTRELQTTLNFLERFCYSIAHDLRAPLRAIRGFAYALEEDYGKRLDETARLYTSRMSEAVDRMDRLITDLLDYGRLSHQRLDFDDVPVAEAIRTALGMEQDKIKAIGAVIDMRLCEATVHASRALVEDVLRRLLSNALKFRKRDEQLRITIAVEVMKASVRISVTDNGIGINERHLQKVFGLFETLQPSFDTGAGLAFVSKAVERMNGKTGVNSAEGKGSTFWVELPKSFEKRSPALPDMSATLAGRHQ